jgi:hypothetical protein
MADVQPVLNADEFEQLADEDIKVLYKKKDDESYVLDVKGVLSSNKTIKTRNQTLEAKAAEIEQRLQSLAAFEGLDIEQVRDALQVKTKIEEKKLIDKGEFDKIRLKDREDFQKQLSAKDSETSKWQTAFQNQFINGRVLGELVKQGVLQEGTAHEDAVKLFMPMVKVELDPSGNPIEKIVDSSGMATGKTLEEAAAEFKRSKPYLFASNGASGIGANPGGTRGGAGSLRRSAMTREEKVNYISTHGQTKYNELPE